MNEEQEHDLGGPSPTAVDESSLRLVHAPPPADQDWQVSRVDGPDWELKHFTGGVEKIERQRNMLIFHFGAGGRICVRHGVTYAAPEVH